jgi:hypothetical protein
MTTATLRYNLADPDDRTAHRQALDAPQYVRAIREYDEWLRACVKYREGHDEDGGAVDADVCRQRLWAIVGGLGVRLWDDEQP